MGIIFYTAAYKIRYIQYMDVDFIDLLFIVCIPQVTDAAAYDGSSSYNINQIKLTSA